MIILCTQDDTRDNKRNVGFLDHGQQEIFAMLNIQHPANLINPTELANKAKEVLNVAAYGEHPELEAGYISGRLERIIILCELAVKEDISLQSKEIYV